MPPPPVERRGRRKRGREEKGKEEREEEEVAPEELTRRVGKEEPKLPRHRPRRRSRCRRRQGSRRHSASLHHADVPLLPHLTVSVATLSLFFSPLGTSGRPSQRRTLPRRGQRQSLWPGRSHAALRRRAVLQHRGRGHRHPPPRRCAAANRARATHVWHMRSGGHTGSRLTLCGHDCAT